MHFDWAKILRSLSKICPYFVPKKFTFKLLQYLLEFIFYFYLVPTRFLEMVSSCANLCSLKIDLMMYKIYKIFRNYYLYVKLSPKSFTWKYVFM